MSTVRATYSGFVGHEGVPTRLVEGTEYPAEWSLVVARPELFSPVPEEPRRPVVKRGRKGVDPGGADE